MSNELDRKFCVAPMMGYTTPYARTLYRLLSKKAFLFSEMIASNTLIYSKNFNTIITGGLSNLFKSSIKTKVKQNKDITVKGLIKISRLIN